VDRILSDPYLWIGDEMGLGKTRQAVRGACALWREGVIDQVVVLAPAQVYHEVWFEPEMGQLREHMDAASVIEEYRPRTRFWSTDNGHGLSTRLRWIVTNYEFIRNPVRLGPLLARITHRTLLVLDESLAVAGHSSQTTKACLQLRKAAGRVLLLNGTEGGGDTPAALYSQALMMDASVLGCRHWYEFKARYAVMGGYRVNGRAVQITGWTNLDDLWARLKPYYLRRTKILLDLPPKIPYVNIGASLEPESWRVYQDMRRDAIAVLEAGASSAQAGVRALRLAQVTSGFLGGVQELDEEGLALGAYQLVQVGREKLNALLAWYDGRPKDEKVMVWCRFRAEAERTAEAFRARGRAQVGTIVGGQTREERQANVALLDPRTAPQGGVVVVGTESAGAFGLNLSATQVVVHLSSGFSHVIRTQSDDRAHRPGLKHPVEYFDVVASGPDGQKTVDHAVAKALRVKADLAAWGPVEWSEALKEE
jgi:hypothetical protein